MNEKQSKPLSGVNILDLSTVLSGPIAVAMLADQGASVIKIETPEGDTCRMIGPAKGDLSGMYIAANRGKRSIALDLKHPGAAPVLRAMIGRADVLVSNFRPGVMERLGLEDSKLAEINPRLIRLKISGYGPDGPFVGDKVYDAVIQAAAGFGAAHREFGTGAPGLLSTAICDKLTSLTAAQAIVTALYARERDGQGRLVEVSMLDAALAFQWPDAMYNHVFLDQPPPAFPHFGSSLRPWKTSDGYVASMAPQQAEFTALCEALRRPDIPADPRFATLQTRGRHSRELRATLEPLFAHFTSEEIVARGRELGVPIAKVNEHDEVIRNAQVVHNQSLVEMEHGDSGRVRLARSAAKFDGQPMVPGGPAAHLGEHTDEVLAGIGLDKSAIEALVKQGVVARRKH